MDTVGRAIGATRNNRRFADAVSQTNIRTGQDVVVGKRYEYVAEAYCAIKPAPC